MRKLTFLLALSAAACSPAPPAAAPAPAAVQPREALRLAIDSMVNAPEFRNAHWGVLIVDPERGDTLYSRNAGKIFVPASNQKIVTGAVALAQLGPDYRYRTSFLTRGTLRDGTLRGDLLVVGRGDPSISDRMRDSAAMAPLYEIADTLRARGIRRIEGRVLAAGDAFPGTNYGFGWAYDQFDYYYSAPVDELIYNEASTTYVLRGGARAGDSVSVRVIPPGTPYPPVRFALTTVGVATDTATRYRVAVTYDSTTLGYTISGQVRAGDSTTIDVAHHDAKAGYLHALRAALEARGTTVTGRAPRDTTAAPDTLWTFESPTMRDILPAFEKRSQNQIGEILIRTLGLEKSGVGTASRGADVIEKQLADWGVDSMEFIVRDGSGLSRYNFVSPRALVQILDAMRRHRDFEVFRNALPIAGVDGTIRDRMKNTPAQGNVRAKTGYVAQARNLSGYVTTADGRLLIFSLLCNNYTVPNSAVERVQDAVLVRLAGMRLDGAQVTAAGGR